MRHIVLVLITALYCLPITAQIENIFVETYYISDDTDATDTFGGGIESGTKTYRVFVNLAAGSRILSVYGDQRHPLRISSTSEFFNHVEDGVSFGHELSRNRYGDGTVPLDTYLAIGQVSKSFNNVAYFGVPKPSDEDGSVVGGSNNDGGSEEIDSGLLTNDNEEMGIPLTISDGLQTSENLPNSWLDVGIVDVLSNSDTTIFGANDKSSFSSSNALLRCSGAIGPDPETNIVLVAHLTTRGELQFELNIEVAVGENGTTEVIKYVATNEDLNEDEIYEPLLSYPYECGCTDPNYLEANTTFACSDSTKCITPVVYGCMDTLACNYDPNANFNVAELCCYVGYCNDFDLSVICPELQPRDFPANSIRTFPNPAHDKIYLETELVIHNPVFYRLHSSSGALIQTGKVAGTNDYIPLHDVSPGYYILNLFVGDQHFHKKVIKH